MLEKAEDEKRECRKLIGLCLGWRMTSYVLSPYLEHLPDLGHLYAKEQKECDLQAEWDNLRLWWANYLPFGPGTPSKPLTPGAPCLPLGPGLPFPPLRPSIPSSPRDVRWKNGKSITCILLECLEGEKA